MFTDEEEEILKLFVKETKAKTELNNFREKCNIDALALQEKLTIASIALKEKVKIVK